MIYWKQPILFLKKKENEMDTKLISPEKLLPVIQNYQAKNKKVVWTNGCFDILHVGHIKYLKQAKTLGDLLVLGLNSDNSIKSLKGEHRPVFNENDRVTVMNAVVYVDYIVLFDNPSPLDIIKILKPDIYAKGGDYTLDTIEQNERWLVDSYGGEIQILPIVPGVSTSDIIEKIRYL